MNKNILRTSAERVLGAKEAFKERALQIGHNAVEKVITPDIKGHLEDGVRTLGLIAAGIALATSAEYSVNGAAQIVKDPGSVVRSIVPDMHVSNPAIVVGPAQE